MNIKSKVISLSMLLVTALSSCSNGSGPQIKDGDVVKFNYELKAQIDGKKKVVDTTEGKQPLTVMIGKKMLIPGFETEIIGMKAGQKKSFTLNPEEAYGLVNEKNIVEVDKSKLTNVEEIKVGQTLSYQQPNTENPDQKVNRPVKVVKVEGDKVTLDFNHPLAGKTLHFSVSIVEVRDLKAEIEKAQKAIKDKKSNGETEKKEEVQK